MHPFAMHLTIFALVVVMCAVIFGGAAVLAWALCSVVSEADDAIERLEAAAQTSDINPNREQQDGRPGGHTLNGKATARPPRFEGNSHQRRIARREHARANRLASA